MIGWRQDRGFTLIEVLVSITIFMVLLGVLSSYYVNVVRQVKTEERSIQAKVLLMQNISEIQASPGLFPLVYTSEKKAISTVTCHDKAGLRIASVAGVVGYTGALLDNRLGNPSGICTEAAAYEVQVTKFRVAEQELADVHVVYKDSSGNSKISHGRVEIQSLL